MDEQDRKTPVPTGDEHEACDTEPCSAPRYDDGTPAAPEAWVP